MPDGLLVAAAAVLGLIFGSFGTVVAYRLPKRESVVAGRSKCPSCGHTISAFENIPFFSYVFLRGRCRNCGARISPTYPLIELATAVLFALAAAKFGWSVETFAYAGLFWTLVVLTVIDLRERKLPDVITLPAFVIGLGVLAIASVAGDRVGSFSWVTLASVAIALFVVAAVFPWRRAERETPADEVPLESEDDADAAQPPRARLNVWGFLTLVAWSVLLIAAFVEGEQEGLAGALVGTGLFSGFFFAVAFTYVGGMGGGDVKLALVLGAFAGYLGAPGNVIVAMFAAVVAGGLVSAVVLFGGGSRKAALPFGPFLALGTIIAIFAGERIQDVYGSTL